jgi:hypothetical protein
LAIFTFFRQDFSGQLFFGHLFLSIFQSAKLILKKREKCKIGFSLSPLDNLLYKRQNNLKNTANNSEE